MHQYAWKRRYPSTCVMYRAILASEDEPKRLLEFLKFGIRIGCNWPTRITWIQGDSIGPESVDQPAQAVETVTLNLRVPL